MLRGLPRHLVPRHVSPHLQSGEDIEESDASTELLLGHDSHIIAHIANFRQGNLSRSCGPDEAR